MIFLSCKANASVFDANSGHGLHTLPRGPKHKINDLKKILYKVVEWNHLAQDGVYDWALHSTVTKILVHKKLWDILTS